MRRSSFFKESYQFDFPVMVHSFLIHFIEKKLTTDSRLSTAPMLSSFEGYQLVLKSYRSTDHKVLFLKSGSGLENLLSQITENISQTGLNSPVSGFELVGIPATQQALPA